VKSPKGKGSHPADCHKEEGIIHAITHPVHLSLSEVDFICEMSGDRPHLVSPLPPLAQLEGILGRSTEEIQQEAIDWAVTHGLVVRFEVVFLYW